MSRFHTLILALLFVFTQSPIAQGAEHSIDSRVNLTQLAQTGQVRVFGERKGRNFEADASAVIPGDFSKLARASADYNRYQSMGMPYLEASRSVGNAGSDILYVWNWMQLSIMGFSQETKHCFEVRFSRELANGAAGSEWQIHPCPKDAKYQLPASLRSEYEDDPAFDYLNGSWYMHPVTVTLNGKPERLIYVRYVLAARPSNSLAGLVGGAIMDQFKQGAKQVIQILAREAVSQP